MVLKTKGKVFPFIFTSRYIPALCALRGHFLIVESLRKHGTHNAGGESMKSFLTAGWTHFSARRRRD